jgi:hypothetical protein
VAVACLLYPIQSSLDVGAVASKGGLMSLQRVTWRWWWPCSLVNWTEKSTRRGTTPKSCLGGGGGLALWSLQRFGNDHSQITIWRLLEILVACEKVFWAKGERFDPNSGEPAGFVTVCRCDYVRHGRASSEKHWPSWS